MNSRPPSIAQQPLKFPGLALGSAPAPTLDDVMTRLSQMQQNQAQILRAVQGLEVNVVVLAEMLAGLFEATTPPTAAAYQNVRSICHQAVQDIVRICNRTI